MNGFMRRLVFAAFLSFFSLTFTCASVLGEVKQPDTSVNKELEVWEFTLTGEVEAKCELTLKQSKTEKDKYFVSGEFSGKINDKQWGAGRLKCALKGKTTKSVFKVKVKGHADMEEGEAAGTWFIWGNLRGTLSKCQGFGSFQFDHEHGSPSGKWTAERMR